MVFRGLADRIRSGGGAIAPATGDDDLPAGDDDSPAAERDAPADRRAAIAACPACGHDLDGSIGRCPGCGQLLIAGVRARTAAAFALVGCMVGLLGGALVAGAVMAPRLAAGDAAIATIRSGPEAGSTEEAVWVPFGVAGSIRQVAAVNDRLATSAAELDDVLARRRPAAEVAAVLRRVNTDARIGSDAARRLEAWEPAAGLAAEASRLYAALTASAADGLAAPLSKRAAYARAGREVRAALRDLAGVTAATFEVAVVARVDLPGATAP
jgi:hypothetical protein